MARRERRSVKVEVMRQEEKTMQRFLVDQVKSICSPSSVNAASGEDKWEMLSVRSCCTWACRGRRGPCRRGPCRDASDPL